MNCGDIVHLNWTPNAGTEMAKSHYGVVVSCEEYNSLIPRIIIAPITSKPHKEFAKLRIKVDANRGKISGYICLDHLRAIDPLARKLARTHYQVTPRCIHECKEVLRKIFKI